MVTTAAPLLEDEAGLPTVGSPVDRHVVRGAAAPKRPLLRYHGGKWRLALWLMQFFPPHRMYVEPFAGSASVLMQKDRASAECINDLDDRVVNLFRVLRDPAQAERLRRRLHLTPFARTEFDAAYEPTDDPVELAARTVVLSFMGHGSDSIGRGYRTGFRCKDSDGRSLPSNEWANWPDQVPLFVDRLRGVAIERRDAIEVIGRLDSEGTLLYVDPPYPFHTRTAARRNHGYRHEMTDQQHRELAAVLHGCAGMVVLSGYATPLYDRELYPDWERHSRKAMADGARARTEVVWLNPACTQALERSRGGLFAMPNVRANSTAEAADGADGA